MRMPKQSPMVEYYDELPFPLGNLPRPEYLVQFSDVVNVADPLLRGVYALLTALSEAAFADNNADLHYATCVLAGQVKLCLHVLERYDTSRKETMAQREGAPSPEGRSER